MGDEWKSFLDNCILSSPKSFWALALGYANSEDLGTLFTATDADGNEDAWGPFYAEPHTIEVDGKQDTMDETAHLAKILDAVENGKSHPMYLYLGANKYQITRTDTETIGDNKLSTVHFAGPGKGGAIVKGPTYFVIGLYEEKREQNKASCGTDLFKVCEQINSS